jgi:hypothetical protein
MAGDDEIVAGAGQVRYSADRLAPSIDGATAASATGPSEDGAPTSPPSQPVGALTLRRVRHRLSSTSAVTDGAGLTARRAVTPCVRRMQMGRSRGETPIRGAASERTERADIRSGELPGVTVRQVTSPTAPVEGRARPAAPANATRRAFSAQRGGTSRCRRRGRWPAGPRARSDGARDGRCSSDDEPQGGATVRVRPTPTSCYGLRPPS